MNSTWNDRFWAICLLLNIGFGFMNFMVGSLWCILNFICAGWMIYSRFGSIKRFVNWVKHDMLKEIF